MPGVKLGPLDCNIPMPESCLDTYEWNTLGSAQRLAPTAPLGTTAAGFVGDGTSPVGTWRFKAPEDVAITSDSRTVYVADTGNRRVRAINLTKGTISTVAGTGKKCTFQLSDCGDGNPAAKIDFDSPSGLALSPDQSSLFVADRGAHVVWKIDLNDTDRTANLLAGTGRLGPPAVGDGGPAIDAPLVTPRGMAATADELFISDSGTNTVRRVNIGEDDPTIATAVGDPSGTACQESATDQCGSGTSAADAKLNSPHDVSLLNDQGDLLIADTGTKSIRLLSGGQVQTLTTGASFRPTFVSVTAHGDAIAGPAGATGGFARIDAGRISSRSAVPAETLFDYYSSQSVPTFNGAVVAPNSRFLVAARTGANQVQVYGRAIGANIQNASLTGAAFPDTYKDKTLSRADLTGIFQQGAQMTGMDLKGANVAYSQFDAFSAGNFQEATIAYTQLGRLTQTDLGSSQIGERVSLDGDRVCLARAELLAPRYANWELRNSSLSRLASGQPVEFSNAQLDDVDFRRGSAAPSVTFRDSHLDTVTFYDPATSGRASITFENTSTGGVPTTNNGKAADTSKDLAPQHFEGLNQYCAVPTNTEAFPSQSVTAASDYGQWGRNDSEQNRSIIVATLGTDPQSHVATGTLQTIFPNLRNQDNSTVYLKSQPTVDYTIKLRRTGRVMAVGQVKPTYPAWRANDYRRSLVQTFDISAALQARRSDIGRIRQGDQYDITVTYPGASNEYRESQLIGSFTAGARDVVKTKYAADPRTVTSYREQYDGRYTYVDIVGEARTAEVELGQNARLNSFIVNQRGQGGQTGGPVVNDQPKVYASVANGSSSTQFVNGYSLLPIRAQHGYNTADLSERAQSVGSITNSASAISMTIVSGCGDCSEKSVTRVTEAPTYLMPAQRVANEYAVIPGKAVFEASASAKTTITGKPGTLTARYGYSDNGTFMDKWGTAAAHLEFPTAYDDSQKGKWMWTLTDSIGHEMSIPVAGALTKLTSAAMQASFGRVYSNVPITATLHPRTAATPAVSAAAEFGNAPQSPRQSMARPTNLTVAGVPSSSGNPTLSVKWEVPDSGLIKPKMFEVSTFPATSRCETQSHECLLSEGLEEGVTYEVRVSAIYDTATPNTTSVKTSAFIHPYLPRRVVGVSAEVARIDPGAVKVSWTVPSDETTIQATGYRATALPGGQACEAKPTAKECVIEGLSNDVEYTFSVESLNGTSLPPAKSDASAPVVIPALESPPAATDVKVRVTASQPESATVGVTWKVPGGNMYTSDVEVSTTPASSGCTVNVEVLSCTIADIPVGAVYEYVVTTKNRVGSTPAQAVSFTASDILARVAALEAERDAKIKAIEQARSEEIKQLAASNRFAEVLATSEEIGASAPPGPFKGSPDYEAWAIDFAEDVHDFGSWSEFYEELNIGSPPNPSEMSDSENFSWMYDQLVASLDRCPVTDPVVTQSDLIHSLTQTSLISDLDMWGILKKSGRTAAYSCIWIQAITAGLGGIGMSTGSQFYQLFATGEPVPVDVAYDNPYSQRVAKLGNAVASLGDTSTAAAAAFDAVLEKFDKQIRAVQSDYSKKIAQARDGG